MTFYDFLSGAVAFGFVVCGLFFLSYWRRSREELYLTFALAFAILGLGQAILSLGNIPNEERGSLYLFRLAAFILILVAIYRKNRAARR